MEVHRPTRRDLLPSGSHPIGQSGLFQLLVHGLVGLVRCKFGSRRVASFGLLPRLGGGFVRLPQAVEVQCLGFLTELGVVVASVAVVVMVPDEREGWLASGPVLVALVSCWESVGAIDRVICIKLDVSDCRRSAAVLMGRRVGPVLGSGLYCAHLVAAQLGLVTVLVVVMMAWLWESVRLILAQLMYVDKGLPRVLLPWSCCGGGWGVGRGAAAACCCPGGLVLLRKWWVVGARHLVQGAGSGVVV